MAKDAKFVVVCCVCKRVRSRVGRWYRRASIPESVTRSHTYCPTCAKKTRRTIVREIAGHAK